MLGVHIRAQLSVACPRLDGAARQLGTSDVFVETKYDGSISPTRDHPRSPQITAH